MFTLLWDLRHIDSLFSIKTYACERVSNPRRLGFALKAALSRAENIDHVTSTLAKRN
jgi:hypothetical protein